MEQILLLGKTLITNLLKEKIWPDRILVAITLFFLTTYAIAGPGHCEGNCFTTSILDIKEKESCKQYTLQVSHNGNCKYALSHFTIGVPCGKVDNATNSEGWPFEFGTDPKTGLYGLKVDNIQGFGEGGSPKSFTVSFTVCPDDETCINKLECWSPVVAYKAGQCIDYDTLEVKCNSMKGSVTPKDETCFNSNDGAVILTFEGGVEPYNFAWSNGATSENLEGIGAGEYTLTITDAQGEELTLSTIVQSPERIEVTGTIKEASCNGVGDGSIDVSVEGGVAPFQFLWSNGMNSEDIDALSPGTYGVKVSDANGCTSNSTFVIESLNNIVAIAEGSIISCGEEATGTVDLTVSGGTAPYTFSWSNGAISEDLSDLGPGFYSVVITDANGCSASASASVTNERLSMQASFTKPTCNGGNDGAIEITVNTGTAPYTYQWTHGATTKDVSGLSRGVYTVQVTDAKGCTGSASYFVSEPSRIYTFISVKDFQCNGGSSATLDLYSSGGTKPYAYLWSNGATTEDISVDEAGIYSVVITDANGCETNNAFTFDIPGQPLQATYEKNDLSCYGDVTGSIDLSVSGGKLPYSYKWSNGARTEDLIGLSSGTYYVTVTDNYGCSFDLSIPIEEPTAIGCTIIDDNQLPECGTTGNVLSTSIADVESYEWLISSPDNSWSIEGGQGTSAITYTAGIEGSAATFTLILTFANGCSESCDVTVNCSNTDSEDDTGDGNGTGEGNGDSGSDGGDDTGDGDGTDTGDDDPTHGEDGENDGSDDPNEDGSGSDGTSDNDDPDNDEGNGDSDNGDNPDDDGTNGEGEPDEGDDTDEDGNNNGSDKDHYTCTDCFETAIISTGSEENCRIYTLEISSDGNCAHALSHFTVAIPCGEVSEATNSEGWAMEYGRDPKTGLFGFKVDDIHGFGEKRAEESFTVTFKLCPEDISCADKLTCWEPVVAYKAGTCIFYDNLQSTCSETSNVDAITSSAYPNPFTTETTLQFTVKETSPVTVELYSIFGIKIATLFSGNAEQGQVHEIKLDGHLLSEDTYLYKVISTKGVHTGKIMRRH